MSTDSARSTTALAKVEIAEIARALADNGLWIDLGAAVVRVRSVVRPFAAQLRAAYPWFPFVTCAPWADLHIEIERPSGLRRWLRRQVLFRCDGRQPFEPFPGDSGLPLFEWGSNWLIGRRLHDLLLFHAGVLEKGGYALLMPALPGSGKSTLTAALSLRGWRLLSDEFGALDPVDHVFKALLKPVALKNQSIDVIRGFANDACFGPEFPGTRKGTVAHLAATPRSVEFRQASARPGAIVLPQWRPGSATRLDAVPPKSIFAALAFNSFNYGVLGAKAFEAVVRLARECPAWQLIYSELDEAIAALSGIWSGIVASDRPRNPVQAPGPAATGTT